MYLIFLFLLSGHCLLVFFFFNDTATTEIYTLSLHDALPISDHHPDEPHDRDRHRLRRPLRTRGDRRVRDRLRSEEHTSELQSRLHLVCRLLLEKKKNKPNPPSLGCLTLLKKIPR